MFKFTVIAPGDLKEKYFADGCADYFRKMSSDAQVTVREYKEARLSPKPGAAEINAALEEESERILSSVKPSAYVIALCVEGREMTSEALAKSVSDAVSGVDGRSAGEIVFIIGSSYGLSERVKASADLRLSLSRLTFPHRMVRLMLAEIIYRTVAILYGKNYHK